MHRGRFHMYSCTRTDSLVRVDGVVQYKFISPLSQTS